MTKRDEHFAREVEYWTSKVAEYRDKLRHADTKLKEAMTALAEFAVGDVVLASNDGGRAWDEAIVRKVEPHSWGSGSWYSVSYRKKDGDWSKSVRQVFDHVKALDA